MADGLTVIIMLLSPAGAGAWAELGKILKLLTVVDSY